MKLEIGKTYLVQLPEDLQDVALEYHDEWLGKTEILTAHRQMNRWIDTKTGKFLKENGRTMYAVRWWPLVREAGILCRPVEASAGEDA